MEQATQQWAQEEFGHAELGDRRRVVRLVQMAASAALRPGGTVTSVLKTSAQREGAFRFLSKQEVRPEAVARASHEATIHRCRDERWVYVPIDGTSLALTDRSRKRDVGQIGRWSGKGRGLQVVSAVAVSMSGALMGVCGQKLWARMQRSTYRACRYRSEQTEMGHSTRMLREVHARFAEHAPKAQPWYQLDRAYDAMSVLQLAQEKNLRLTVRVSSNRRVRTSRTDPVTYLFPLLQNATRLGKHRLELPARPGRPARVAVLEVRARKVSIELKTGRKRRLFVPITVVTARECNHSKPLHWMLMTTSPVMSFQDALSVIHGYTMRWRIEEFHRAWKRGVCNVEDTQLRGGDGILKWCTILAAVASRALRLTQLARKTPDVPATDEFTRWEIDATIALLQPKGIKLGAKPTLAQVVRWIADLGGYTGKSSGGPPGQTVIGRGLEQVQAAATALKNLAEM